MPLELTHHRGAPANAAMPSGRLRSLATAIAHGREPPPSVPAPAVRPGPPGRVVSAGTWTDATTRDALARVLGPALAPSLRPSFEWYACRGAFFHNDAHFDGVLFGVWCLEGAAEVVFPRVGLRVGAAHGDIAVFDPFEVHGVLAPGRSTYIPGDYADRATSVFIGFELDLTVAVSTAFGASSPSSGRTLSSRTRIDACTGAFE